MKKAIDKTTKVAYKVLVSSKVINAVQFALLGEIIAHYDAMSASVDTAIAERYASRLYTRKELRDAHGVLRNRRAAPYFVSKNVVCKTKVHGVYNVAVLKLAASSAAKKTEETSADAEVPAKKKRATRAKKEIVAPVMTEQSSDVPDFDSSDEQDVYAESMR